MKSILNVKYESNVTKVHVLLTSDIRGVQMACLIIKLANTPKCVASKYRSLCERKNANQKMSKILFAKCSGVKEEGKQCQLILLTFWLKASTA